ncbi:MAG: hypothetical protein CVU16_03665 [Betaproteobacteria bacterium HGW-Betaproteobacteria-10]|jgi:hypothetical protein|nr:MAG: hypothetical protein CVU16_03665 [Betaproteobacteria bacterium HGW-Betaproteobacteria-10]
MNLWIALLIALLAWPAQAEIYKCRLANGKTEISNSPCSGGSGTVTVRPDDTVTEQNRQQAERDVERMHNFVEKRQAEQLADEKAERERQTSERQWAAQQRVYASTSMDDCLRELAQQSIDPKRRAELEAICRAKVKNEPTIVGVPVPVYGIGSGYHPPRVTPLPTPRPEAKPETRPGKPCPRGDKYCVR